jgi:adenylate kinase
MVRLRKALNKEMKGSKTPLIIDGHYSHDLYYEKEVSCVFVLRKAPWELQKVLQERLYSSKKVWENLEAEIMGVIAEESRENFNIEVLQEVNTTGKEEEESVVEMQDIIEGKSVSFKPIDWITFPQTLQVLVNRTCTLS